MFIRNDCANWTDKALSYNATMYIVANCLFVVGSFFFLPSVEDENPFLITGLMTFVVGCTIFLLAPMYDIYRTLTSTMNVSREYVAAEVSVSLMFMLGNVLFIIGCIIYLPSLDMDDEGLFMFILGSFFFLFATFVLSVKQAFQNLGWLTGSKAKGPEPKETDSNSTAVKNGLDVDIEVGEERKAEEEDVGNPLQAQPTGGAGQTSQAVPGVAETNSADEEERKTLGSSTSKENMGNA